MRKQSQARRRINTDPLANPLLRKMFLSTNNRKPIEQDSFGKIDMAHSLAFDALKRGDGQGVHWYTLTGALNTVLQICMAPVTSQ
jgi:hypothetical protein